MKFSVKLMAVLLAFAMLISLASCRIEKGDEGSKAGTDSSAEKASGDETSDNVSEDSVDEITAETVYESALEALETKTDVKQSIKSTTVRELGQDTFEYELERTALYKGIGSDALSIHISDKTTSGSTLWKADKYFAEGKYIHKDFESEAVYYKEMDAEDAVGMQIPLALFDKEIYENIDFKDGDESVIILSDTETVEKWLAPDYAKLTDLTAEIKLDENGEIQSYVYTVDYIQGPASYKVSYEVALSAPDAKDEIKLPEEEGTQFDGVEVMDTLALADIATKALVAFEYTANTEIYSQAGGIALVQDEDIYMHGIKEADFVAKTECTVDVYQAGKADESTTIEQTYRDGKLVSIIDGEKVTQSLTMKQILDSVVGKDKDIGLLTPDASMFASCEVNDLMEFWHISYTLNEKGSEHFEDYVNEFFYKDKDVFADYIDKYTPEKGEGFISIDRDTLLITSAGMDYEGDTVLEGESYLSGFFMNVAFGVSDVDTYKEITGELPEETEPEEKPTPLFYKVTAPDGTVMYLLGTIHTGDSRTAYLPKEIYDAFEASDALAVEFDLIDFEESMENDDTVMQMLAENLYYTDGTTIKDHLTDEELYEAGLQHVLTAGLSPRYAEYMTPSTWGSLIDEFYDDYNFALSSEYGVDYRFLRMAKDKGMEIINVESAEEQYGMTAKYTESIHKMLLYSSLFNTRHETIYGLNELYEMWCEGDEEKLREYLNDDDNSDDEIEEDIEDKELAEEMKEAVKQYNAILGADRDVNMVEKAKEYMESGKTVFFAVGLAHMISETGLVDSLRADGYTVERVSFSEEVAALSA